MKHKTILKISSVLVIALSLFYVFFILAEALAKTTVHEINNFEELIEAATLSRTDGGRSDTYILKNNIEITQEDQNKLNESEFKHISFGSLENPFTGTFDGEGHYISHLKYQSTLEPKSDTGLFSYTSTGAVIKNLTIMNADVQADYRGGLLAGYSEGTTFENITIKDSHLFVAATNNVLTLITDGGIRGGAIVGEANKCVLYNCESIGTRVNTNNTSGVAALAGKGLSLGGLVGICSETEVEYSRVIGGLVKSYYDVAVGAVGGNTIYVGGLIGQMKDASKVIDCFSTSELNFYCATYVSVGAGNSGHIGGITAAMQGDRNEIYRSHYAGKATSRQYNAVLVIPVIQDNVNISGIADIYKGGPVVNTYFKRWCIIQCVKFKKEFQALNFFCANLRRFKMRENDIDIVQLIINNMPEENELQYRIKLYMQSHKQNCNDFIYTQYSKETTFFNTILKSLSADLGLEIVKNFKEKNMI